MDTNTNYITKVATIDEIIDKWDYEASIHPDNILYPLAKKEFVEETAKGNRIVYIGLLNNEIICDLTAIIKKEGIGKEAGKIKDIITDKRVFLCAIRTNKEYQNNHYFSKLLEYAINDLKTKGYTEYSLSVEENNKKALEIYKHLGFTNYIGNELRYGHHFFYYYK